MFDRCSVWCTEQIKRENKRERENATERERGSKSEC
jgi:hypothetical protein